MIRQAVILAGGLGSRLGKLTKETPKPLLKIGDTPFLEYLLMELKRYGIKQCIISTGYLAEMIHDHFRNGEHLGIEIVYSQEKEPLGTGGALKFASHLLDEMFLVLNGDSLAELDYTQFAPMLPSQECAIAVRHVADTGRYGRVEVENGHVISFAEKSVQGAGEINAGIYLLNRQCLEMLPNGPSSLEDDLFPALVAERKMRAVFCGKFFLDIGLPESYADAQQAIPGYFFRSAVFLDRDGVINRDDHGYFHDVAKLQWIEEAPAAIKLLNDAGFYVFCVTNQSGIGRGYYTAEQYELLRERIDTLLFQEGAHIDHVYHCPHTPQAGCTCRKPAPGLLEFAFAQWSINKSGSFLIGDKQSDLDAGAALDIPAYHFTGQNLLQFVKKVLNDVRNTKTHKAVASACNNSD